jgi:nucleoside-diphosphate-sugar epimerase
MRYFITGATGFIGGRIARQLAAQGHQLTALVRDPSKAGELEKLGINLFPGDITDKESIRKPMQGADGVFHIAAWYKVGARDTSPARKINVEGTRNVLEVMKELGIRKGVYTSTLAINSDTQGKLVDETYRFAGTHLTEYDRTKAAAHEVAESFIREGLPLVIVMPGLVYGPGDTSTVRPMLISFLKNRIPMIPEKTAFSWGHVDDTAAAHILAMEKGRLRESYIICGPTHTLQEGLRIAHDITGKREPRVAPAGLFRTMSKIMGVVEKIVPVPDNYTSEGLKTIAGTTYIGDNAKAKRELGFDPRALKAGLEETLHHEMKLMGMI